MKDNFSGQKAAADAQASIAADHKALKQTLGILEGTGDLNVILAHLTELLPELEAHFAKEEGPGGMHQTIGDTAPHLLTRLQLIMGEHREFVTSITRTIDRSRSLVDGPIAEVLREVRELCRRLRDHEALETELLGDAMYTDLGGKG